MTHQIAYDTSKDIFGTRRNIDLPYCVVRDSCHPGPHIIILAATHGNEYGGVMAMINVINALETRTINLKQGKISFILTNPEAFAHNKRFMDTNMNRSFDLQPPEGSEGERVVEIRNYLNEISKSRTPDFLLDLHSISVGEFTCAIMPEDKKSKDITSQITNLSTRFVFRRDHAPGTSCEEALRHGIPSAVIECGNHHHSQTIQTAQEHIINLLIYFGLIDSEKPIHPSESLMTITEYTGIEPIVPDVGFRWLLASERIYSGSPISQGELYAVSDRGEYRAPVDCTLFIPDPKPHPTDHDAGFLTTVTSKKRSLAQTAHSIKKRN